MRVKRYVVDTMPDAMLSIRSELGSDAVILSTKEIKTGGFMGMFRKKKIEVVAAVEKEQKSTRQPPANSLVTAVPRGTVPQAYQMAASQQRAQAPAQESKQAAGGEPRSFAEIAASIADKAEQRGSVAVMAELGSGTAGTNAGVMQDARETAAALQELQAQPAAKGPTSGAEDTAVLREIREMKQWIEKFARQTAGAPELPERLAYLQERLRDQELDESIVEKWIGSILGEWEEAGRSWTTDQFDYALRGQLTRFLGGRIGPGISPDTRIVFIAGPTGVGKTTTIAKLAADQLFRHGRKVGLITSDTYRISAVEQLRTYASILNLPLEVVQSPGDLQRAMTRLESCELILMDTAGRNYRNEMLVAELQSLLAPSLKSETYLVLSLTSKSKDMKLITEHFSKYQLDKVVFTKLDETGTVGPLFNLLNDFPLGLSYMTNGQNVPDDLLMASEDRLYSLLLGSG